MYVLYCSFVSFSGGKKFPSDYVTLNEKIKNYLCARNRLIRFELGYYREAHYITLSFNNCHFKPVIYSIILVFLFIVLVLNTFSAVMLVQHQLYDNTHHLQLLAMNGYSLLVVLCFLYYMFYRRVFDMNRVTCVIGFQVFAFSLKCYGLCILSLTLECCIAVYFPLQHHSLLTPKRLIIFNACLLVFTVSFDVFLPIMLFGFSSRPLQFCNYFSVFSTAFLLMENLFGLFLALSIIIGNFSVVITLCKTYNALKKKDNKLSKIEQQARRVIRQLLYLIIVTGGCSFPLQILILFGASGIKKLEIYYDIGIALMMTAGIWNVLIYFFGDAVIREKVNLVSSAPRRMVSQLSTRRQTSAFYTEELSMTAM